MNSLLNKLYSAVVIAALFGCQRGVQDGRFLAGGVQSVSTSSGRYIEVRGQEINANGPDKVLLRVLVIFDSGKAQSELQSHHARKESILKLVDPKTSLAVLEIVWNRNADTIRFGNDIYPRDKGNVYVVIAKSDRWQVCHANSPEIWRNTGEAKTGLVRLFGENAPEIRDVSWPDVAIGSGE